jgi:folate-dependent phosphoribosylglycinamide formyltransferase PurN
MNVDILKVLANRAQAATALEQDGTNIVESVVQELEEEQEDWDKKILDDNVVQMLHNQFVDLVFEANLDL